MGERKIEEMKTYKIKGVEIFSVGTWNRDKYDISDLHEIVRSFSTLKSGFLPYLKLGHDDKQKFAKSSGLPSVGRIDNVYVRGEKLIADFDWVPEKVYNLLQTRAYSKVSCEIYSGLDVNGTTYAHVLGAVALLGAEVPGVMNLDDILGQYSLFDGGVFEPIEKQDTFKQYSMKFDIKPEDENMEELEKVKAQLEAEEAKRKQFELDIQTEKDAKKALEDQLATSVKESAELKEFKMKAELELQNEKLSKFMLELENKKLSTPAMKDLVTELLSDKSEYSVKDKKYTKQELVTEILTLSKEASKVNLEEGSKAEFSKKEDKEKVMDEKIKKYAAENKCSYGQAMKAVSKSEEEKE